MLSAALAARLEHEVLQTGLTYCGHPLACAAGVAALAAYESEGLITRSKALGAEMRAALEAMQARHPVIGDVRGGHGLFVVVELVADRAARTARGVATPPALAALTRAALDEGVSFATRGNLLLLAPPLVIRENEIAGAGALLDPVLARFFT